MYERFYGLNADPFRLSPDHRFCFNHDNFAKAKAYIDYALHRAEGFVMITGRPGTGKTTLVHDLLDRLTGQDVKVATLMSTRLGAEDLLRMTAYAFGLDTRAQNKAMVLQGLLDFLSQQYQYGKRSLLIIDESQDLSAAALEELRLLTNLQHAGQPLLQIVLIGQESLRDLVRSRELEQLHQRLLAAWHLEALSPQELVGYIQHRLIKAGWRGDPEIQPGVMEAIYRFSGGVPRMINLVSSRLLLHGFIEESHIITLADVEFVLGELRQEELTPQQFTADNVAPAEPSASELAAAKVNWTQIDLGLSAAMLPPVKTPAAAPFVAKPSPPAARRDDSPPPPPPSKNAYHEEHSHWEAPPTVAVSAVAATPESPALTSSLFTKHWRLALLFSLLLFGASAAFYLRQFVVWRPLLDHAKQWISASTTQLINSETAPAPAFTPVAPETPPPVIDAMPTSPQPLNVPAAPIAAMPAPQEMPTDSARTIGTIQPTAPAIATASQTAFSSMTNSDLSADHEGTPPSPLTIAVTFARNSTIVEKQFFTQLAEVVARLTQFSTARCTITGYSDRYGNAAYNLELSRRRANAVADYLVAQGVTRTRLDVNGRGPREQPNVASDGADAAGRVVELTVNVPAP
ncbi:hypothetical protein CKO09_08255 [Chromatium weissei]|nr:hypothetical protein [Chromatium weissei]